MNNKQILKNIGISMVMKPLSMILSFIYTPMALAFLGTEKYGTWAIILNLISWINYFDIGIGNGLRNRLTEACAVHDKQAAKTYVSTAYLGTFVISFIFCVVVVGVWKTFQLSDFFNLSISGENADTVIVVSVLFVCINFVLSLSKTSAYALQRSGFISVISVVGQALQIIVLFLLSRFYEENLMAVAVMYGIISLFDNVLLYFWITKGQDCLKPSISSINIKYLKPLLTLGAGFFAIQISALILNMTDNLLISGLYGSAEVTPYSIVYKFFYMVVQIHGIIIMPMWSAYTEAMAKRDLLWIRSTMKKVNLITLVFSCGTVIGILLFEPLAAVWLGRRLEYGRTLIIIVGIYMIIQMFANNYASFLCGVGEIRVSAVLSIIEAALNIPLSVFFAKTLGMRLSGIIFGSFCVMFISFLVLPVIACRWIRSRSKEWGVI